MKDENYNYIGCAIFFLIVVLIVVVGSSILYVNQKEKLAINATSIKDETITDKKKGDKEKDFIYFTSEENLNDNSDLAIKKAVINLDSTDAESVNEELEKIYENDKNSLALTSEENTCENESNEYQAIVTDYAIYSYSKYITLVATTYNYSCGDSSISSDFSYTFDVSTGKLLSFSDLLDEYNTNYTKVINKITEQLESNDLAATQTLNELKENSTYIVYISEEGKLIVKYIVKNDSIIYNDIIEID